jgi:hypothetical protein
MRLDRKPGESFREEVARVGNTGIVKVVLELAGGANAARFLPHVEVIRDQDNGKPYEVHPLKDRYYSEADAVMALESIVHKVLKKLS